MPTPGVSQAEALHALQDLAAQDLPRDVLIDYAGPLRQFVQESSGFVGTFGLALIIIFLALAALFESFRDPLVILVSIPMSVAGALVFISLGLGGASLNIYTEVGLVTLMGLISKHGILIVEVANEAQRGGMSKAGRDHPRGRAAAAADPDDDGGDGAGRGAADHGHGRRRGVAVQHGTGDRQRPVDRHAVHAVRTARGLSGDRGAPHHGGGSGAEPGVGEGFWVWRQLAALFVAALGALILGVTLRGQSGPLLNL